MTVWGGNPIVRTQRTRTYPLVRLFSLGFTAKEEVPHTLHGSHSAGLEKIVAKVTGHELDEAHHKHTNGHSKRHGKNPKQGDVPVGLRVETQRRMAHTLDLFWKLHGMGMVGPNATRKAARTCTHQEEMRGHYPLG